MSYSKSIYRIKKNRFWMLLLVVLLIGMFSGCFITKCADVADAVEVKVSTKVIKEEHKEEIKTDFKPIKCNLDEELQEYSFDLCKENHIDWYLVMALMKHESSFNPDIVSITNDYGLMQINKINHGWLEDEIGVTDLLDPKQNIKAGVFILDQFIDKYKEPNLALMCYNMGESGASGLWDKGIYTTKYTDSVLEKRKEFLQNEEM